MVGWQHGGEHNHVRRAGSGVERDDSSRGVRVPRQLCPQMMMRRRHAVRREDDRRVELRVERRAGTVIGTVIGMLW